MQKDFIEGISSFYYLMICADGIIDRRELQWGNIMLEAEKIDKKDFNSRLDQYSTIDKDIILESCLQALKKCSTALQLRCVAWMGLIANADGFMAPKEWELIFTIYSHELELDLKNILDMQKELKLVYEQSQYQRHLH